MDFHRAGLAIFSLLLMAGCDFNFCETGEPVCEIGTQIEYPDTVSLPFRSEAFDISSAKPRFFKFRLDRAAAVEFQVFSETDPSGGFQIELLDSLETSLYLGNQTYGQFLPGDGSVKIGYHAENRQLLAAGSYFLTVRPNGRETAGVQVNAIPDFSDPLEWNNDFGQATPISTGQTIFSKTTAWNDVDCFSYFMPPGKDSLTIRLAELPPLFQLRLTIYEDTWAPPTHEFTLPETSQPIELKIALKSGIQYFVFRELAGRWSDLPWQIRLE